MTSPRHRWVRLFALAATVFFVATCLPAQGVGSDSAGSTTAAAHRRKRKKKKPKPTVAATTTQSGNSHLQRSAVARSAQKPKARSVHGKSRALPRSSRARLARLHLQSDRISEIQQALIGVGYLNPPTSGAWDDATRSAMRRYQTDSGFAVTGLPDAKSLMKLGLGPHPLPRDLEPATAAAQVTTPPATKVDPN